jgi:uncharacterized membrane protein
MWTREELKTRAKAALRQSYWKAFLISLVIAIAIGSSNLNWRHENSSGSGFGNSYIHIDPAILALFAGIGLLIAITVFAFRIFLGYPLEVGGRRYFLHSAQYEFDMNYLGSVFNGKQYMDVVKAMLWKALFNFLWFLLFIIPGIVKIYAYRMVPYILADNPNIGYRRALELSKSMTDGHKGDMFLLDLSFIGWYILGAIAFGIGVLFVNPYFDATQAELYIKLREFAIDKGLCTYDELLPKE